VKIRDIKIVCWPYVRKHSERTAAFIAEDVRIIMQPKIMRDLAKKLISAADRIDPAGKRDA
jgi:hypothetical protein